MAADGRAFAAGGDSVYTVDASTRARLWAFRPDAQAALAETGVVGNSAVYSLRYSWVNGAAGQQAGE